MTLANPFILLVEPTPWRSEQATADFKIDDIGRALNEIRRHGKVAVCVLMKPSTVEAIKQQTRSRWFKPKAENPTSYFGLPIRATLPEAWPEPFRIVFEGDPIHQGWTMFGGMPGVQP